MRSTIDGLRNYFEENGHLAREDRKPDGMIRAAAIAAVQPAIAGGIILEGDIDYLLRGIGAAS